MGLHERPTKYPPVILLVDSPQGNLEYKWSIYSIVEKIIKISIKLSAGRCMKLLIDFSKGIFSIYFCK